jgi:hypothetical protein
VRRLRLRGASLQRLRLRRLRSTSLELRRLCSLWRGLRALLDTPGLELGPCLLMEDERPVGCALRSGVLTRVRVLTS